MKLKKLALIAFAAVAAFAFTGCDNDDDDNQIVSVNGETYQYVDINSSISNGEITGTMTFIGKVEYSMSPTMIPVSSFQEPMIFEVALAEDGTANALQLYMNGMQFVPAMPAVLMRTSNATYTGVAQTIISTGDLAAEAKFGASPIYTPFPAAAFKGLNLQIDGDDCIVTSTVDYDMGTPVTMYMTFDGDLAVKL